MQEQIGIDVVLVEDGEEKGILPVKAHRTDAGFDLFTPRDFILAPESTVFIDTLVKFGIPDGYVCFIKSKSGLMLKGIVTEGVIDSGYTGTVGVKLFNNSYNKYPFKKGDKITQIVFLPIPDVELAEVEELKVSERGEGGFGSTGR